MKLSRRARRTAASAADHGPAKRACFCRNWVITEGRCILRTECLNAGQCPDYEDAETYHLNRLRQAGRLLEVKL